MDRNTRDIVLCSFMAVALLTGCGKPPQPIVEHFMDGTFTVTRLVVTNGNTGNPPTSTTLTVSSDGIVFDERSTPGDVGCYRATLGAAKAAALTGGLDGAAIAGSACPTSLSQIGNDPTCYSVGGGSDLYAADLSNRGLRLSNKDHRWDSLLSRVTSATAKLAWTKVSANPSDCPRLTVLNEMR